MLLTKDSIKAECQGLPRKDLAYLLDIGNDRIIELERELEYLKQRRDYIRELIKEKRYE